MQSSGFGYHDLAGEPTAPNPQPPSHPPPRQQTHLDPSVSTNYLNSLSPLDSNLDHFLWSRQLVRPPDLTGVIATSSPSPPTPPLLTFSAAALITDQSNTNVNTNSGNTDAIMSRKPRKRSRASRRAPTTVLTTDTANFRAMVQEFTGIPAPPFTGSLPFQFNSSTNNSRRFDIFGSSSSSPSYLLRPFAQRLNPSSSSSSSASLIDYHNFSNSNTQNLSNPSHNIQNSTNPFADSSIFTAKFKALGDSGQGNDDHQAQRMKVGTDFFEEFSRDMASSSSSHENRLQEHENGREKVQFDAMAQVSTGEYTDLQRPLAER